MSYTLCIPTVLQVCNKNFSIWRTERVPAFEMSSCIREFALLFLCEYSRTFCKASLPVLNYYLLVCSTEKWARISMPRGIVNRNKSVVWGIQICQSLLASVSDSDPFKLYLSNDQHWHLVRMIPWALWALIGQRWALHFRTNHLKKQLKYSKAAYSIFVYLKVSVELVLQLLFRQSNLYWVWEYLSIFEKRRSWRSGRASHGGNGLESRGDQVAIVVPSTHAYFICKDAQT